MIHTYVTCVIYRVICYTHRVAIAIVVHLWFIASKQIIQWVIYIYINVNTYIYICIYIYMPHVWTSHLSSTLSSSRIHLHTHTHTYIYTYAHTHTYQYEYISIISACNSIYSTSTFSSLRIRQRRAKRRIDIHKYDTGWRRPIGCLKLQVIFHKRATNYRAENDL